MHGKKYQWVLVGGYSPQWFTVQDNSTVCTKNELLEAVDGLVLMESLLLSHNDDRTLSGLVSFSYTSIVYLCCSECRQYRMFLLFRMSTCIIKSSQSSQLWRLNDICKDRQKIILLSEFPYILRKQKIKYIMYKVEDQNAEFFKTILLTQLYMIVLPFYS